MKYELDGIFYEMGNLPRPTIDLEALRAAAAAAAGDRDPLLELEAARARHGANVAAIQVEVQVAAYYGPREAGGGEVRGGAG